MHLLPPQERLTDGVVTLRLPSADAGDVQAVIWYSEEKDQLEGVWLPLIPGASPEASVNDWLDGWAGRRSHNGPTLVVTFPNESAFIGIVGFGDRGSGCVEMIYGMAPRWRGRGLASRAAALGARWALTLPEVTAVELRIDRNELASQHVARNAGFRPDGTVSQFVPGTGETYEDLRFILD